MNDSIISSAALSAGTVIRQPVGNEKGYWVGAPGVFFDAADQLFYLTYRLRRPRGVHPDRGGEARIAVSSDGVEFRDIWSVTKGAYGSTSIERCAVRRGPDGKWRYFASFVDPEDSRWTIHVIEADGPDAFDPAQARPLFKAVDLGLEGVKDPWIFERDGVFHMLVSVAVATPQTADDSHATNDIFNTGDCVSATALARSADLTDWEWLGVVFQPEPGGWDCYCRRLNSFVCHEGRCLGFYDGSAGAFENYEEKTGLVESADMLQWRGLSPTGPALTSPHASTSLRYIDAQLVGEQVHLFYELARADDAHDLRLRRAPVAALSTLFGEG